MPYLAYSKTLWSTIVALLAIETSCRKEAPIFTCSQNQASADCESSTREMEGYQQMVREKAEKITELSDQIQAQEAVINQLMGQATSQATAMSSADELDKAVMEVMNLRRRVNEAEDEKQKAFARVLVAEGMLKLVCT